MPHEPVEWPISHEERIEAVKGLISDYSRELGLSEADQKLAFNIIYCENRELDPELQSYIKDPTGPNGREDSWGLSQIHLPNNSDVRPSDTRNPAYSVRFLLERIKEGKAYLWSCYKLVK